MTGEYLTCQNYLDGGWCTEDGQRGPRFAHYPYYYSIDHEKRKNRYSALNCPQCGCRHANVPDQLNIYGDNSQLYCTCFRFREMEGFTVGKGYFGRYTKAKFFDRAGNKYFVHEDGMKECVT